MVRFNRSDGCLQHSIEQLTDKPEQRCRPTACRSLGIKSHG